VITGVILLHPNGEQQEVLLAGIPREGESIRLANGVPGTALIVEHVLWMQGNAADPQPQVMLTVRPRDTR
jgi:hypothetical protein